MSLSEVSFVCSDSYENGRTKEKLLAKCSGKSPFSKHPWFQSDALEFSTCQMLGQTCGTSLKMMEEKAWVERQNSKKGLEKNEHACSVEGVFVVSDASPCLKVTGQTQKIQS